MVATVRARTETPFRLLDRLNRAFRLARLPVST